MEEGTQKQQEDESCAEVSVTTAPTSAPAAVPETQPPQPAARTQEEVDAERGFTEDELNTCIKVLNAFHSRIDLLQQKEYKALRSAGIIFVEGINKRYFKGLSPQEYNHKKARRIARKERQKLQALEDQRRLAKTKMRERKLRKMEQLMEEATAVPMIEDVSTEAKTNDQPVGQLKSDPLSMGVVTVPADRVATRFNGEKLAKKRKKNKGKQNKNDSAKKGKNEISNDRASNQNAKSRRTIPAKQVTNGQEGQLEGNSAKKDAARAISSEPSDDEETILHKPEECYICKTEYFQVHHFYDRLCPQCATLNWEKRIATVDLKGYIALVTGGRVKIGFETAVKLLRCGATVIVTTRFTHDAALRFSKLEDFNEWKHRLHIYSLDMRFLQTVEAFCRFIKKAYPHLDIIINNAAQTIRRPPAYYEHLLANESVQISSLPEDIRNILQSPDLPTKPWGDDSMLPLFSSSIGLLNLDQTSLTRSSVSDANNTLPHTCEKEIQEDMATAHNLSKEEPTTAIEAQPIVEHPPSSDDSTTVPNVSAILTQLALVKGDEQKDPTKFPPGRYDEHGQQIDLRRANSWVLQLDEVSTVELAEVHVVNALAPYTINSLLRKMLIKSPNADRFIINVSSVEGEFYHNKMSTHPHTNMAKASLNMMTRTAASYYARDRIWMNAVDTGWISDMNPVRRAQHIANKYGEVFRNPIDEVDGAARILDPIFVRVKGGKTIFGKFLKDYHSAPW